VEYRFDEEALEELGNAHEPGTKPELQWPLVKYPLDLDERER
jgi:hypothetical protein